MPHFVESLAGPTGMVVTLPILAFKREGIAGQRASSTMGFGGMPPKPKKAKKEKA